MNEREAFIRSGVITAGDWESREFRVNFAMGEGVKMGESFGEYLDRRFPDAGTARGQERHDDAPIECQWRRGFDGAVQWWPDGVDYNPEGNTTLWDKTGLTRPARDRQDAPPRIPPAKCTEDPKAYRPTYRPQSPGSAVLRPEEK